MTADDRLPDELQDALDAEFERLRAAEQADAEALRGTRALGWVLLTMATLVVAGVSLLAGLDPGVVGLGLVALVAVVVIIRAASRRRR